MRSNFIESPPIARRLALVSLGMLAITCPIASAADYEMVVSMTLLSAFSDSSTFDGTNHDTLPPILDIAALEGGSFSATFRFSTVTPDKGDTAVYELPSPAGMTVDLRNSSGAIVHHGSNPSDAVAIIANNTGSPPYVVDQVFLASSVNSITGSVIPAPIYSASGNLYLSSDVSFFATLTGDDYLTDLSIPTNAATYMAFPNRVFDVFIEFGDGDYGDQIGPYQLVTTIVQYQVNSLTVTPIPEPGLVSLLVPAISLVALCRRRVR